MKKAPDQVNQKGWRGESQNIGRVALEDEEHKRMNDEFIRLMGKYKEMEKRIGGLSLVHQLLSSMDLPYNTKVMAFPLPPKFRAPQIQMYNGSKDPVEHLETFKTHMTLHDFLLEIACRVFPLTLKCSARAWFGALQPNTIHNLEELGWKFFIQFITSRKSRWSTVYILTIK